MASTLLLSLRGKLPGGELAGLRLPDGATRAVRLLLPVLFLGAIVLASGGIDFLVRANYSLAMARAAAWAGIYAGFGALALLYPAQAVQALRLGWPMLLVPVLAGLSWLWSSYPDATLRAALQLVTITIFGLLMGSRLSMSALTGIIFGGLGLTALMSAAVAVGAGGLSVDHHGNLIGAFSHKNVLGNTMGVLVLVAAALCFSGRHALIAALTALFALALLVASGSATALVATLCSAGILVVYGFLKLQLPLRLFAFAVCGLVAVALLFVLVMAQRDLFLVMLDLLDRDPTLTGRSTLWDYAAGLIAEHFWIGTGYQAFWAHVGGSESDWLRWIVEQELHSFHNGYVEIMVELGAVGAAATAFALLAFAWVALRYAVRWGSALAALPLLLLVLACVTNLAEVAIFIRHGLLQFLLSAFFVRMLLDGAPQPATRPLFPAAGARGR